MKRILVTIVAILVTVFGLAGKANAQLFWNTDGVGSTWTAANWGTSAGGPFTTGWTNLSDANFTANSLITFVTNTQVGNVTVADGVTVTMTAAGTYNNGGAVRTLNVGAGSILDYGSQGISTAAGNGFIKSGAGIFFSSNGNQYTGGFTLNAGTMIIGGVNAMGGGTGSVLNINGGTLAANATRNITARYANGINVGGNFTMGAVTTGVASGNGSATANITFADNVNLGAATRTITIGSNGTYSFGGVISGAVGTGLTVDASAGATGNLTLTNVGNTYTGATTINGGILSVSADGNLGNATNAVVFNGGTLRVTGTTLTSFGSHALTFSGGGIDVNTAGNTFTVNQTLGAGSLAKLGAGTLVLANLNTYAGGTLISAGTLQATADGALGSGNISLTAGTVFLALSGAVTNNYIGNMADLSIVSGAMPNVALNFSGTDTIGGLVINGVVQAVGVYGAVGSGAQFEDAAFSGTGFLNVTTLAVIPEPATYMLFGVGLLICAQQFRRRRMRSASSK